MPEIVVQPPWRLIAQASVSRSQRWYLVAQMLDRAEENGLSLKTMLIRAADDADVANTLAIVQEAYAEAVKAAKQPDMAASEQLFAVRLLGRGLGNDQEDAKVLVSLLNARAFRALQSAALVQLRRNINPRVVEMLLARWKSYTPTIANEVRDLLLSRPFWTRTTLEAVKRLPVDDVEPLLRQRLLHHKDPEIRGAAETIFHGAKSRERRQVTDTYWPRLPDKTDQERGAQIFAKACAMCHQLNGARQAIGPDLRVVYDNSPQALLTAILDPNQDVEPRYISYRLVTKDRVQHIGTISSETETTITLLGLDGKEQRIFRDELNELTSTGKSLMPEGLEKNLSPQDLADVIAYVRMHSTSRRIQRGEAPGRVR
jgi:putative heme-binding domain-containing protein